MEKCKHKQDMIGKCTICMKTYEQIKDEWFEFIQAQQVEINDLVARIEKLELNNRRAL